MPEILIIEDEPLLAHQVARALEASNHVVRVAGTAIEGREQVEARAPDLVLLDLRLPDHSGLWVLDRLQEMDAALPVVMMSAYGSVGDAVDAMRRGALDYVQKPLDLDELGLLIDRLLASQKRARELDYHRERGAQQAQDIVGNAPALLDIFSGVARLREAGLSAAERPAILLTGETGTGKGVAARAIHDLLGGGPFLEVNCSAMPSELVEAELFGHERGAFTGAVGSRPGLFEAAEGGTLFLDEIGELDLSLQAKFLNAIEGKRVRRLGATRDRAVDVHVVAATNRDLGAAVSEGVFRADLLHRLSVLSFELPPLRQRGDDIGLLARHFATELGRRYRRPDIKITAHAEVVLQAYPWPGNLRELRNVIERAIITHHGSELDASAFSLPEIPKPTGHDADPGPVAPIDLGASERELIHQALDRAAGNQTRAAELLGVTRYTLRYRLRKWGMA